MRSINADKIYLNGLNCVKLTKDFEPYIMLKDLVKLMDVQTTAYDIDKVIEQLEDRSKEYNSGVSLHGKPEEIITNEAIEIVKGGGIDGR